MNFQKRAGIELVERSNFAGFGERVPLVLHAAICEHERKIRVGQFGWRQERPRKKLCAAGFGWKSDFWRRGIFFGQDHTSRSVMVHVANGSSNFLARRARPLARLLAQCRVVNSAQIVAGFGIPRLADFIEHFAGALIIETFFETHPPRDLRDDLPVGTALRRAARRRAA